MRKKNAMRVQMRDDKVIAETPPPLKYRAQLFITKNIVCLLNITFSNILYAMYAKTLPFFQKKGKMRASAVKLLSFFSANNINKLNFKSTRKLNLTLTNIFVKLTLLSTTGP